MSDFNWYQKKYFETQVSISDKVTEQRNDDRIE